MERGPDHLLTIPGEPALRVFKQLRGVFLKSHQVVEGVDAVERTNMDQTHK